MNITIDGVYQLSSDSENSGVVAASGTFGGGTVNIGYLDETKAFQAFTDDASFTDKFEKVVTKGTNLNVAIELTGSAGADINIIYSALKSRGS